MNKIKYALLALVTIFAFWGCFPALEERLNSYDPLSSEYTGTAGAPQTPTGVTATALDAYSVRIQWTAVSDATGYRVQKDAGSGFTTISGNLSSATTSYDSTGLSANTTYTYRVIAFNSTADSLPSANATATTSVATGPATPSGLAVSTTTANSVVLTWTSSSPAVNGYRVYKYNGSTYVQVGSDISYPLTVFTNIGLNASTSYQYKITAFDGTGESLKSSAVTATTKSSLVSGVVAYYSFDGNQNDISGNGFNGTSTPPNAPAIATGKIGSAFDFDGGDDYIEVAYNAAFNSANFTVSVWVKPDMMLPDGTYTIIDRYWNTPAGYTISLEAMTATMLDIDGEARIPGTYNWVGTAGEMMWSSWRHIVMSYNGVALTMYTNGVLANTTPVSGTPNSSTAALKIGCDSFAGGEYFSGVIDEVGIWNRALTIQEVTNLYNGGVGNNPFN